MKRLLFGFLWFLGFYIGSCAVVGASIGLHSSFTGQSEKEMQATIDQVSDQVVNSLLLISLLASAAGTATQKLPGTHE